MIGSYTRIVVAPKGTVLTAASPLFPVIGSGIGGIAQGTRSLTLWVNITAITGNADFSLNSGMDETAISTGGGTLIVIPTITAIGTYQQGYASGSPGNVFVVMFALTGSVTCEVIIEVDSGG